MGDRKSSKKEFGHIKKHLKITLNGPIEIKDEAYCQVLHQITEHPDEIRCLKGWKFLAILASCFAPSQELYYSILNFLVFEIKNNQNSDKVKHANYIFVRLIKTFENKRKQFPSETEIAHIEVILFLKKSMKPLMVPVYFFSDTHTLISLESYHSVRDLKTTIMKKVQFNPQRIPYYNLYEICVKEDLVEERFLDDNDKVVDILAVWDKEKEESNKKKDKIEFKLYLKLQLFYNYAQTDIDTITIIYVQTNYEVISGRFNLNEETIVSLAALQLSINFRPNKDQAFQDLQSNLEKYIPTDKLNDNPLVTWVQKIIENYSNLKHMTKLASKITYLDNLKTSPLYQSHQFNVKYSEKLNSNNADRTFPEECVIAIKPNGISILDNDRNELEFLGYDIIPSWGVNYDVFVIVISRIEGEVNKHYFETHQTKVIQYILECYTNLIVNKSIHEAQRLAEASIKKFDIIPLSALAPGETFRSRSSSHFKKN